MKTLSISSAVILLAASLCAIGSPAAETLPPDLAKRASSVPPALKSQIGHSNTFYRAVDESEATAEGISTRYPLGGHPSSLLDVSGDFSAHEALYVTHDLYQAQLWGDSFEGSDWYMIEFGYEPMEGLTTKSFLTPSDEWKAFVNQCDNEKCPQEYDIVEGPLATRSTDEAMEAADTDHPDGGKVYVYQAAFTSANALNTLRVKSITKRPGNTNGKPSSFATEIQNRGRCRHRRKGRKCRP